MTIATLLLALLALMATDAAPGTGVATPASASSPAASPGGTGIV